MESRLTLQDVAEIMCVSITLGHMIYNHGLGCRYMGPRAMALKLILISKVSQVDES